MRGSSRRKLVAGTVVALSAAASLLVAQPASQPNPPQQAGSQPAAPQPAGTQPATTQAGTTQAAATQSAGTQPASQPAASQPSTKPSDKITVNFKDASLDAVLEHLASSAGFVVMKEGPVDGRVSLMSKTPVRPEEAVTLLAAALKNNGYTAIQDGRVLTIMPRDKAKKGSIPVRFGADPETIEPTQELITQVIPIRNVDAAKLKGELQPLLSPEADVTATTGSNAIVVTDTAANIRRLVNIISGLDRGEGKTYDIRITKLKHANAAAAAKLITAVFKSEPQGMPGQPGMPPMQPGQQPPGGGPREGLIPGGGVDQALRGGKVYASADDRTNTLVVTGPAETLKVVDDILKQLDANPAAGYSEIRAFTLDYAEAESTSKMIASLFKPDDNQDSDRFSIFYGSRFGGGDQDQGKVKVTTAFDERTNTVIVTAPAGPMEIIEGLIKKLDANPVATADLRVFRLEHGDAFDVALMLESIFKPKESDGGESGFIRFLYLGDNPNARKGPKMTAVSDDRTNSVIVTAPTEMLKVIEGVIQKLDSNPAQQDSLFIYHLKNAQADNLEWVLNTLFGNYQQAGQGQNQPFDPNAQQQQQNGRNNRQQSDANRNGGANRGNRGGRRRGNMPRLPQGMANAVNELTGEVFVVADEDTNSLIVTTATKFEEQVRGIIDELDRPVPQVLIKVLVAEVTHTNSVDIGTDFSILNRRANGRGESVGTNFGTPPLSSGLVVSVLEEHVSATLRALEQKGRLEVLSRPYVLCSDNQVARITVGEEVARVTSSQTTESGLTNSQFVYEEIGIILDVTPHINPDGLVILDVSPTISQLTDRTVQVSEQLSVPVIDKRTAESRVGVRSGDTIVIGGLMEDEKTRTVDKVPVLGDLPVFGPAFRRTRNTKRKTELLIFLTPHVAQQPEALGPMSEEETRGTRLTPKAVGPGVFREHLRGMQRGRNSSATQPARPTTQVYRPRSTQRPKVPDTRPAEPAKPPTEPNPRAEPAPDPALQPAAQRVPE